MQPYFTELLLMLLINNFYSFDAILTPISTELQPLVPHIFLFKFSNNTVLLYLCTVCTGLYCMYVQYVYQVQLLVVLGSRVGEEVISDH